MAESNVRAAPTVAKPPLDEELRGLMRRVGKMEDTLRGAAGVLTAIREGCLLDALPKEEEDHPRHEAATAMLGLLEREVVAVTNDEEDWDVSCELSFSPIMPGAASFVGAEP